MEEYISRALEGKTKSENPFYCLSCGGPGSGKGLPAAILKYQGYNNFVLIDKHIMDGYPEYEKIKHKHLHPEKVADMVQEYYRRATNIVVEAAKQGISIIFEDHGDCREIYKKHIIICKSENYETFLTETTCAITPLRKLASILSQQNGFPDMKDWRESYHRRILNSSNELKKLFDHGVLLEKVPDIKEGGHASFNKLSHFTCSNGKVNEEIIDEEGHKRYKEWEKIRITPEYKAYFARVDAALGRQKNDDQTHYSEKNYGGRTERGFLTSILDTDKQDIAYGRQ